MQKILITGSTGLVGSRIVELLREKFEFIPLTQFDCDITDGTAVAKQLHETNYDTILHLAAYTNVDGAEKEKNMAYTINVQGTKNLFDSASKQRKQFIYISTDFVFDGTKPPYTETSIPHPLGYYGKTKYEGEKVLMNKAMIVRISYPYRSTYQGKPDFVARIRVLLEQGRLLHMVTNSSFTPTCIDDIAGGLSYLLNNYTPVIYHLVGSRTLSPYDAGRLIARSYNLDEKLIEPTTYEEYFSGKAARPQYGEIISKKNNFYTMRGFEAGLKTITQK